MDKLVKRLKDLKINYIKSIDEEVRLLVRINIAMREGNPDTALGILKHMEEAIDKLIKDVSNSKCSNGDFCGMEKKW